MQEKKKEYDTYGNPKIYCNRRKNIHPMIEYSMMGEKRTYGWKEDLLTNIKYEPDLFFCKKEKSEINALLTVLMCLKSTVTVSSSFGSVNHDPK